MQDFEIKPYEYFNNVNVDGLFDPDEENTYPLFLVLTPPGV